jgi:hypothetical protein
LINLFNYSIYYIYLISIYLLALISYFTTASCYSWNICIESISNGKKSPFKPFFVIITKLSSSSAMIKGIYLFIDRLGNELIHPALTKATDVLDIIPEIQGDFA